MTTTNQPRVFRLPALPDSSVDAEFYTILLQIEATKGRLRENVGALRDAAGAPFRFIESTKDVLQQAAQIPLNAIDAAEKQVQEHPWIAVGSAVATGAVGGYFDNGRLEALLADIPAEIVKWFTTLVSRLVGTATGAVSDVVTQSVVGVVSGAVAAQMVDNANDQPPDPNQTLEFPPDYYERPAFPRETAQPAEATYAAGAV